MTHFPSSAFDGNTILLECEDNENVFISGCEIIKFKTDDKTIDYISLMGNSMCPYTFAIGEKIHTSYHFITNSLKTIKPKKEFFNATNNSLDPFDYHLEKCG